MSKKNIPLNRSAVAPRVPRTLISAATALAAPPLALADVDHLALAVDIAGRELDSFRDAQTGGIDGDEDRSHLETAAAEMSAWSSVCSR